MNTPFYHYDWKLLEQTLQVAQEESRSRNYKLHYAIKANGNKDVVKMMKQKGFGADCVSGGEIKHALSCGITADEIVYAGVGKTDEEIQYALEVGIYCFHVESIEELEVINEIASSLNCVANVAVRLNPNICGHTHAKITTGLQDNKFGFQEEEIDLFFERYYNFNNINFIGIHLHIGSQITDMEPFIKLCQAANYWTRVFEDKGFSVNYLNLGGGLGVNYEDPDMNTIPDFENYFDTIEKNLCVDNKTEIHFEPGRALVAQSVNLVAKVLYTKKGNTKNFAIIDAGMTDFLRPALYGAEHKIEKINTSDQEENDHSYSVVGPVCESSDCFGEKMYLPKLKRGDLIKIRTVGAYGESMRLNYNMREENEGLDTFQAVAKQSMVI